MEILRKMQLLLAKIPKGKVTTYAAIARKLRIHPRHAGFLLSQNKCPVKYPCYKVVCSDGSIGGYSGKGGIMSKVKKLRKDGVEIGKNKVNLAKHLFLFR
jgi:O6-methylguanine-DNA--protein-cysteine methyltransferase